MDSDACELPADLGRLDEDTLSVLRAVLGKSLTCQLVDGLLRLESETPQTRISARGLLLTAHPGRGGSGDPFPIYLRPEAVAPDDYELQRLHADLDPPASLREDADRSFRLDPRLGCALETGLSALFAIVRIDIFSETVPVYVNDCWDPLGQREFDSRIEFVGAVRGLRQAASPERVFAVQADGRDTYRLSVETFLRPVGVECAPDRQPRLSLV